MLVYFRDGFWGRRRRELLSQWEQLSISSRVLCRCAAFFIRVFFFFFFFVLLLLFCFLFSFLLAFFFLSFSFCLSVFLPCFLFPPFSLSLSSSCCNYTGWPGIKYQSLANILCISFSFFYICIVCSTCRPLNNVSFVLFHQPLAPTYSDIVLLKGNNGSQQRCMFLSSFFLPSLRFLSVCLSGDFPSCLPPFFPFFLSVPSPWGNYTGWRYIKRQSLRNKLTLCFSFFLSFFFLFFFFFFFWWWFFYIYISCSACCLINYVSFVYLLNHLLLTIPVPVLSSWGGNHGS